MGINMKKYAGETFLKVTDVRDGPLQMQIAVIREGKFEKPELVFETGDILSLNATNTKTLMRAFGKDSDAWVGKEVELYLGEVEYQNRMQEAVLARPISPPLKAAEAKSTDETPPLNDEIPF